MTETKSFLKWLCIGTITGVIMGAVGVLFHTCSDSANSIRQSHGWLVLLLPIAGIFIAKFYDIMKYSHDKGTNLVLLAVRDNKEMGIHHAVCIFVSSVLTHLCGGSSGREGASLQIGASLGSFAGRKLKFDEDDRRIMTMCCMSGMFSAVFGTPATSAIFSMEVVSIGIFYYSAIVPCAVSAISASCVSSFFGISSLSPTVTLPQFVPVSYLKTVILGALCSFVSVIFCIAMHRTLILFRKIKNHSLRAFTGGVIVVILTAIVGDFTYNGTGGEMILSFFEDRPAFYVFAVKIIFTVVTLCSGFKGGEIFPVFFIGSAFGSSLSAIFGVDCSFGSAIGMCAVFCGVTNCPVASVLLSVELFGGEGLPFYILACAVSYMLSGYRGLYSEQKILYSKTKTRYINKRIGG